MLRIAWPKFNVLLHYTMTALNWLQPPGVSTPLTEHQGLLKARLRSLIWGPSSESSPSLLLMLLKDWSLQFQACLCRSSRVCFRGDRLGVQVLKYADLHKINSDLEGLNFSERNMRCLFLALNGPAESCSAGASAARDTLRFGSGERRWPTLSFPALTSLF